MASRRGGIWGLEVFDHIIPENLCVSLIIMFGKKQNIRIPANVSDPFFICVFHLYQVTTKTGATFSL